MTIAPIRCGPLPALPLTDASDQALKNLRADEALVARGMAPSRARARQMIESGIVHAHGPGIDLIVPKPAWRVGDHIVLALTQADPGFASRGALKLAHALGQFQVPVEGRTALDLGASTGGFCDILLRAGVARVYAVDVGHGQLIDRLVHDPRVIDLSGTDARTLDHAIVPDAVDLITADLAFISLVKAIDPALSLAASGADLLALVKPQFEVGRAHIGKGGIVRDADARARALGSVVDYLNAKPRWRVVAWTPSPITGGDGNQEYLVHAHRD